MNDPNIEFTYKDEDTNISIKAIGHITMGDLVDHFKQFCLAVGYHPDTVKEYLEPEYE